jgi:hypothetical protein
MKPNTQDAMRQLIQQIKQAMPFDLPESQICSGICIGCAKKLLEYLTIELDTWEARLDAGEVPTLGDVEKLAKSSKKIYRVMQLNKLV